MNFTINMTVGFTVADFWPGLQKNKGIDFLIGSSIPQGKYTQSAFFPFFNLNYLLVRQ